MTSKLFKGLISGLGLFSAVLLMSVPLAVQAEDRPDPSGTIELIQWKVGFIIGGGGGSGTLHFQGKSYPIGIKGLRVGAVIGVARADIKGDVYHLTKAEDIEGNYKAFQAGGAFAGGPTKYWELKNDKGVILRLSGAQAGLELALDYGGMWLKLKEG